MLVFLGGTCGQNNWRESFIAELVKRGVHEESLFNPVVKDWNDEAKDREERAKSSATHLLFYIADPKEPGIQVSAYSMVEATMALYDRGPKTVVVFDTTGIEGHALKAVNQARKVLQKRFPEASIFAEAWEAIDWLAACEVESVRYS